MGERRLVVIALVLLGIGMASAAAEGPDPTPNPNPTPPPNPEGDRIIGAITGVALDAAPVGGPVPYDVFPNLAPVPKDNNKNGASPAGVTIAGAIVAAGVAGSMIF